MLWDSYASTIILHEVFLFLRTLEVDSCMVLYIPDTIISYNIKDKSFREAFDLKLRPSDFLGLCPWFTMHPCTETYFMFDAIFWQVLLVSSLNFVLKTDFSLIWLRISLPFPVWQFQLIVNLYVLNMMVSNIMHVPYLIVHIASCLSLRLPG